MEEFSSSAIVLTVNTVSRGCDRHYWKSENAPPHMTVVFQQGIGLVPPAAVAGIVKTSLVGVGRCVSGHHKREVYPLA